MHLEKEVVLPSQMREGWGITHDYEKDRLDIERAAKGEDESEASKVDKQSII